MVRDRGFGELQQAREFLGVTRALATQAQNQQARRVRERFEEIGLRL